MKIAYVCDEYPPAPHGGIGTFTRTIALAMTDAGHKVTVVGYGPESGERNDKGVRVIALPESRVRGIGWLINRYRLHRWLKERVTKKEFDIIETPEFGGLLPFPFPYCPVTVRLHLSRRAIDLDANRSTPQFAKWCEDATLKRHPNWIPISFYALNITQHLFSLTPYRYSVIYSPVSIPDCLNASDLLLPERFILFAGTVSARKGAFVLAEACREILQTHKDLHLVYAGGAPDGNLTSVVDRVISILGKDLTARVHFLGRLPHHESMLACMHQALLVAMPSRLETLGLVPLEALACGTPVVYTTAAAGPEIIENGVTGLLADPSDPRDVAKKITRILDEPDLAASLVRNGQQVLREKFSVEKCLDATLSFYERCLADHQMG